MSFLSAVYQLWDLYATGQYFLVLVDIIIVITAVLVILESVSAFMRERRNAAAVAPVG